MPRAEFGKVEVEIIYCVPWGYYPVATWLATEFWGSNNPGDIAIKLTPAAKGRLEVYVDGDKIFDQSTDGGHPNLGKVNELKMVLMEKMFEAEEAAANS